MDDPTRPREDPTAGDVIAGDDPTASKLPDAGGSEEDDFFAGFGNAVEATTDLSVTTGFGAYNDPTTGFGPDDDDEQEAPPPDATDRDLA